LLVEFRGVLFAGVRRRWGGNAGPSTPLRSGRDDRLRGGVSSDHLLVDLSVALFV
jgi:hypothetical protein